MERVMDELELLDRLREQADEISALRQRLDEVTRMAEHYQDRSRTLTEQVKLLTSGPQGDPAKRAWFRWWW